MISSYMLAKALSCGTSLHAEAARDPSRVHYVLRLDVRPHIDPLAKGFQAVIALVIVLV